MERLEAWKEAVKNGHDIGNHSMVHPWTGNFDWAKEKTLEDYTLQAMQSELDLANGIGNIIHFLLWRQQYILRQPDRLIAEFIVLRALVLLGILPNVQHVGRVHFPEILGLECMRQVGLISGPVINP